MGHKKKPIASAYKARLTLNTIRNIDEITGYITFIKHQPANAIIVGDTIYNTIARIEKQPYAFKECLEIETKSKIYRQAKCLSWLIIYKIVLQEITILGIMHSSRMPLHIKMLKQIIY